MKKLLLLLSLTVSISNAQVANDECSGAITISINDGAQCNFGSALTGEFTSSTPSSQTDCSSVASNDIWYSFTALAPQHTLTIDPIAGAAPTFSLYSGDCGSLIHIQCGQLESTTFNSLIVGQTYKIRVISPPNLSFEFSICLTTLPADISVSSSYTTEELVYNIMAGSSCSNISNISSSTGTNFGAVNGIGYFEKNGSTFSLDSGIVITNGNLMNIPNNQNTSNGTPSWPGDADLQTALASQFTGPFYNASSIEFDFIPTADNISFDFLFGSGEYGLFQCYFTDVIAFLLTDVATGITTNLAVVPGTTTPISVLSIRNNLYSTSCSSSNPQYFDQYFGNDMSLAPVQMTGVTIPMTAEGSVTPGHLYHLKLVISDRSDASVNSAIFIESGSFNIGSTENAELSLSNGSFLCDGETTTISINLGTAPVYSWSYNGVNIPDAASNSFVADQAGVYTITTTLQSGCVLEHSISIMEGDVGESIALSDYIIMEAEADGIADFDLSTQTQSILAAYPGTDITVTYHVSLADAHNAVNSLPTFYINTSNPQTVFVRITNAESVCPVIETLQLIVVDENFVAPAPTGESDQYFAPGETLADLEVEGENIQWYANLGDTAGRNANDNDDFPLPMSTVLIDNTTYYATQTVYGIESVERFPVTAHAALGVSENVFTSLVYYPNPVKDVLTLSNNENIEKVVVYNLLGQVVFSKTINERTTSLNLSSLTGGIYIIKLTSEDIEKTFKILKE